MKDFLQNPRSLALKKFMFDVLKNDYPENEELIERISNSLIIDKDILSFSKMINKIYEIGYYKAVNDYKEELKRLNIKLSVNVK